MARAIIFPGRFQPPHRDHVAVAVALAQQVGRYWLALLVDAPGVRRSPDPAFAAEADEHHVAERNPLCFAERAALWDELLRRRLPAALRPAIIPLPRPECDWRWVVAAFPGPRAWVVPDGGDAFDDRKAAFFRARGDRVLRPRYVATTDGKRVRALMASGSPELVEHVDREVVAFVATRKGTP